MNTHRADRALRVPWWLKLALAINAAWIMLLVGAAAYLYVLWVFA